MGSAGEHIGGDLGCLCEVNLVYDRIEVLPDSQIVQRLPELKSEEVLQLNVQIAIDQLINNKRDNLGIF